MSSSLFSKKNKLYKNKKINIVSTNNNNIDTSLYLTGPLILRTPKKLRFYNDILSNKIKGSKNIIENMTYKTSCMYFDDETIFQYEDLYFLNLACEPCGQGFAKTISLKVRPVLIDTTNHMLYIFNFNDDMINYISGNHYNCLYSKRLNSFANVTLPTIKKGKNEKYLNTDKENNRVFNKTLNIYEYKNPLEMYQVKLINNNRFDVSKYNSHRTLNDVAEHFNVNIPIKRLYKFSSSHENKIRLFKQLIEETVGFRIMY